MLWYDLATSDNHKTSWYDQYNDSNILSVTRSNNGTTITHPENNSTWRYFWYNDKSISTVSVGNRNSITIPSIVEFDVTAFSGTPMVDIMDNNGNHMDRGGQEITANGHYKYIIDGENCTCYKDNVQQWTGVMDGTNYRFGFQVNRLNESITFKNFIIYNL